MYDYGELIKDMVKHDPQERISLVQAKLNEMEGPERQRLPTTGVNYINCYSSSI
jgi:hypothetical protein